jgi:hypothetical protein
MSGAQKRRPAPAPDDGETPTELACVAEPNGDSASGAPTIEVIEYSTAVDLVPLIRNFDATSLGQKRLVTITHCPQSVIWSVEMLKGEARRSEADIVAFLLKRAKAGMWKDVGPIRAARDRILASGLAEARHFLDACPPPELLLGDTGERRWAVRISEAQIAEYKTLATTLGLGKHQSYVFSVAISLGLLGAQIVPVSDRTPIRENVARYLSLVKHRTSLTGRIADAAPGDAAAQLEPWGVEGLPRYSER